MESVVNNKNSSEAHKRLNEKTSGLLSSLLKIILSFGYILSAGTLQSQNVGQNDLLFSIEMVSKPHIRNNLSFRVLFCSYTDLNLKLFKP